MFFFCLNEIVECMQVREYATIRRTMCIRIDKKKRTYPHYHLERIIIICFLYFFFFPVLFFLLFLLLRFFSFVLNFYRVYIFTCWPRLKRTDPKKSQKQQFNEKQKQNDFAHLSSHTHTHTLTGWLTHVHSPSLTYRLVIVMQPMRDRDRQGKEMQSF